MRIIRSIFLCVFVCVTYVSSAQQFTLRYYHILPYNNLKIELVPKITFENHNPSFVESTHFSVITKYKVTQLVGIHIGVRYGLYMSNELSEISDDEDKYRLYGGFSYKLPISSNVFEYSFRYRFQCIFDEGSEAYNRVRFAIEAKKYETIKPEVSIEMFTNNRLNSFEKAKLRFSFEYACSGRISTEAFFCIKTEIENTLPHTEYEVGVTLKFTK